jgi:nucleoside-triphosphatase THEP1
VSHPTKRIAALRGGSSSASQRTLSIFAQQLRQEGLRVAGVVEVSRCGEESRCKSLGVQDLVSGETFPISQKLGAGSAACNLDPGGLALACGLIEDAIERGVDVVILSKFGKLEAARSGFCDAFRAAMLADIPVITAVSPPLAEDWNRFAGELSECVDAHVEALTAWWRSQRERIGKESNRH